MSSNKILVVEDSETIILGLKYILEKNDFEVIMCNTVKEAMEIVNNQEFDLALLDIELPDGMGFEICEKIRKTSDKPVIFLTGRTEEFNVVYGLDIGADDYIKKPFGNDELISRIKSVLRRYLKNYESAHIISYRDLIIDIDKAKVYKCNKEIVLTSLEYKILLFFLNNIGKLVTREILLEEIWDVAGNFVNDNSLTVYIKRLRAKLGDDEETNYLRTIRGIGYMLNK